MANQANKNNSEEEVWNAILACEQILEAMPNDRHSLSTLSNAYEQVGDIVRSKEYMMRLAEVVIDENDQSTATDVRTRLLNFADDPKAQELMTALDALVPIDVVTLAQESTPPTATIEPVAVDPSARPPVAAKTRGSGGHDPNLTEEIALAWTLQQAQVLSDDEYSNVVDDLTRLSSGDALVTVSVFHVLQDRQSGSLEKALNTAASNSGCPIIALSNFQITQNVALLLPMDFMISRGVVPYEVMGKHVLVALLNPHDKKLRIDVEAAIGRPCFFYLVAPAEFDKALGRIEAVLEGGDEDVKP